MRRFIGLMILVVCLPGLGIAGQIYGTLKKDGRSLGNAQVFIYCGDKPEDSKPQDRKPDGVTDDYGAYSIHVPEGKCKMFVKSGEHWWEAYPVYSSEEPTRYDFDLIWANGKLILKRR